MGLEDLIHDNTYDLPCTNMDLFDFEPDALKTILLENKGLRILALSFCTLSKEMWKNRSKHLQHLTLHRCALPTQSIERFSRLQHLTIYKCRHVKQLRLDTIPCLKELNVNQQTVPLPDYPLYNNETEESFDVLDIYYKDNIKKNVVIKGAHIKKRI